MAQEVMMQIQQKEREEKQEPEQGEKEEEGASMQEEEKEEDRGEEQQARKQERQGIGENQNEGIERKASFTGTEPIEQIEGEWKGSPACLICRRSFLSRDQLLHHFKASSLHVERLLELCEQDLLHESVMERIAHGLF